MSDVPPPESDWLDALRRTTSVIDFRDSIEGLLCWNDLLWETAHSYIKSTIRAVATPAVDVNSDSESSPVAVVEAAQPTDTTPEVTARCAGEDVGASPRKRWPHEKELRLMRCRARVGKRCAAMTSVPHGCCLRGPVAAMWIFSACSGVSTWLAVTYFKRSDMALRQRLTERASSAASNEALAAGCGAVRGLYCSRLLLFANEHARLMRRPEHDSTPCATTHVTPSAHLHDDVVDDGFVVLGGGSSRCDHEEPARCAAVGEDHRAGVLRAGQWVWAAFRVTSLHHVVGKEMRWGAYHALAAVSLGTLGAMGAVAACSLGGSTRGMRLSKTLLASAGRTCLTFSCQSVFGAVGHAAVLGLSALSYHSFKCSEPRGTHTAVFPTGTQPPSVPAALLSRLLRVVQWSRKHFLVVAEKLSLLLHHGVLLYDVTFALRWLCTSLVLPPWVRLGVVLHAAGSVAFFAFDPRSTQHNVDDPQRWILALLGIPKHIALLLSTVYLCERSTKGGCMTTGLSAMAPSPAVMDSALVMLRAISVWLLVQHAQAFSLPSTSSSGVGCGAASVSPAERLSIPWLKGVNMCWNIGLAACCGMLCELMRAQRHGQTSETKVVTSSRGLCGQCPWLIPVSLCFAAAETLSLVVVAARKSRRPWRRSPDTTTATTSSS